MPGARSYVGRKKRRRDAQKRAIDLDGIVHAFKERRGDYGTREARTYCGKDLWEQNIGGIDGWRIVPARPVTCVACLGTTLTW